MSLAAASASPVPARAERSAILLSAPSLARRRGALLQLARRNGEVRLRIGDGLSAPAGAAAVSELLDALNEDGLLRYGGLAGDELLYLPA